MTQQEERNPPARGEDELDEENKGEHRSGSGEDDLEERKYIDREGNVRHHTKKYMEEHGGE